MSRVEKLFENPLHLLDQSPLGFYPRSKTDEGEEGDLVEG